MNITQHTFVPSRSDVSSSGYKRVFFDYYFNGVGSVKPFPFPGISMGYYLLPSSSQIVITNDTFPILPYCVYDRLIPLVYILLLY